MGRLGLAPACGAVETCISHYRLRSEWDAAFDTAATNSSVADLEALMREALAELLDAGRLQTVAAWNDVASDMGLSEPIFLLSRAEVALRLGRLIEAISNAQAAADHDRGLAYRAMAIAGRAAHLASREEDAREFFGRAAVVAATEAERRDASWGELTCLIDLENPGAHAALDRLSEGISLGQPREFVRAAAHLLYLQIRQGSLDLEQADIAYDVLPTVDDPLVVSSFLSGYAMVLGLSARYDDALRAGADLLGVAEKYRLDFALPYGFCATALACTGLRQWRRAEENIDRALEICRATRDMHAELLCASLLIRLHLHQGRAAEALRITAPGGRRAIEASVAEFMCSRALALACVGRVDEALSEVELSPRSRAVEPVVLSALVRAVCAFRSGEVDAMDRLSQVSATVFGVGAVDLLVVGYRACPELLPVLLRTGSDQFQSLVASVGDSDLAAAVGMPLRRDDGRTSLLSPREREVYDLMVQGLTNREIGTLLFIEESTVKAHTHRIYDKLGIRSRRSADAVQAVLERADQATSATESIEPWICRRRCSEQTHESRHVLRAGTPRPRPQGSLRTLRQHSVSN